jgi:hypothetical protein
LRISEITKLFRAHRTLLSSSPEEFRRRVVGIFSDQQGEGEARHLYHAFPSQTLPRPE